MQVPGIFLVLVLAGFSVEAKYAELPEDYTKYIIFTFVFCVASHLENPVICEYNVSTNKTTGGNTHEKVQCRTVQ